VIYRNQTANF